MRGGIWLDGLVLLNYYEFGRVERDVHDLLIFIQKRKRKKKKSRYKTQILEFQRVIMAPEYDSSTRIRIFA